MNSPSKLRVQALRQRRRAAGLVRVEVWARPRDVGAIRYHAMRLLKRPLETRT